MSSAVELLECLRTLGHGDSGQLELSEKHA